MANILGWVPEADHAFWDAANRSRDKTAHGRTAFFPFVTVADEVGALEYLKEQDRERATEAMGDGFARAH